MPLIFCLYNCSFNPAIQGNGQAYLQGEWQQDSIPAGKQWVTYSSSTFKFDCDSFFITTNTISNINYGADSCMKKGRWTEYMKGRYSERNDTLHLKGFFHNADGTFKKLNTCFRTGVYEEFFKVTKKTDSLVQLSGTSADIPLNIKLVKRTTCTPKPF
ncbi:MAG: fumarate hydratase [Sphingobacteriales bacterium]|nr:MAG: fumarate hydratase [Sphingobacteriales bacterium]